MKKKTKVNVTKKKNKNGKIDKFKSKFKQRSLFEKILTIFLIGLIAVFGFATFFFVYVVISAPDFTEEGLYLSEASVIYYANGDEMTRVGSEHREKVSYDDIPEVFIDALLAVEDSRFLEHSGIDLARFLKASFGQLLGKSGAGGASTLTMQVVKQTFTDSIATGVKGVVRKFTDIYMAVFKIEKNYTKEQIIEFYVNIPGLGSGTFGVEQAAQVYFGKSISEVTLTEAATIAGLFQAPSAYNPYSHPEKTTNRRSQVLNLMRKHNFITDEERDIANSIPIESLLVSKGGAVWDNQGMYDTVIAEVKERTGHDPHLVPMKIRSTFVKENQEVINNIINTNNVHKWPNEMLETGIAIIDVPTGGIAAVGAGRNKKSPLSWNYATQSNRHPGSTSKPLYDFGPAIEYLNWGTGQMVIDDVHGYSGGKSVNNWDKEYKGIMTIKNALAISRNTTALQAFQQVPNKQIGEFVRGLNLNPEIDKNGFIHEAHSIGAYSGESPLTTAAAYATFARGGVYIEPHSFTKIEYVDTGEVYTVTPEKRTVMKDSTAFMINMILKHSVTIGFNAATTPSGTDVAAKTGTSSVDPARIKELKISSSAIADSWQVVYSPDYVGATWIGYKNVATKEHYLTSGVGGTARSKISREISKQIFKTNSKFTQPSSVVQATIELETNPIKLASDYTPGSLKSTEYFRKGTAPTDVSVRFAKLIAPTNLKYTEESGSVNLTWNAIPTPDAISTDYLTAYFEEGYGKWATKYLNRRFEYNNSNIGNIGYQVYLNNNGSLTDLGWTSNNNYKYSGSIPAGSTFVVKSAYSIFKANMSEGVSVSAPTSNVPTGWQVSLQGGTCLSVDEFMSLQNLNQSFVQVSENGTDITKNVTINTTCEDSNKRQVNCSSLGNDNYTITHTVVYKGTSKNVTRSVKNSC